MANGGIDLGGTKIQAAVIDGQNKVLGQARRPTPTEGGPEDVAKEMAETLREAAKAAKLEPAALKGIGVGSPGVIESGNVSTARNLPGWEGTFGLAKALKSALGVGISVEIGNDVQVATDAELKLGAGRPYESLIGVFWGTGVGAGLILEGKPWLGRGGAGEIGHMVVKMNGARCTCGRRGCVEAYSGRAAMESHGAQAPREGQAHRPVQADEGARPHAPDEWHLGASSRATGQARDRADRARDRRRSAPVSPRRSTCSTSLP